MIHTDGFHFHVTDKTSVAKYAAPLEEGMESLDCGECLVAFVASEKADKKNVDSVVRQAVETIAEQARRVRTSTIVVYPYAHLSSDLSSPSVAQRVLDGIHEGLRALGGFTVHRAPFGWYKAFELSCKGHPLSENACTILPADEDEERKDESAAVAAERTLEKEWFVLLEGGELVPCSEFEGGSDSFRKFMEYEISGTRAADEPPPHIRLMRELELVDYEPGSDQGNLRWYPKGTLIKKLLEAHCDSLVCGYGGMQVETPIMYDYDHPQLNKYLNRFPARQYIVLSDDKEFFLRFAACFGQYLMKKDMSISYRDLPCRLYEMTHYSFRREQSGELAGLKRLRCFTMPDMHTLCRDMNQAKEEFLNQYRLAMQWMDDLGLEYEVAFRFVRSFYDEHKDFVLEMQRLAGGRPFLVEMWSERFFYFVIKFEFNVLDGLGKACALSTVQIDVENPERFGITYVDEDGSRRHPLMLHTSIPGAVDRNLMALLEREAARMKEGRKAMLPVWLSPTQVRILPVSEKYHEAAVEIARRIPYRVDVDDRDYSLGKKIRAAEKEWIPYIAVFGEKEAASSKLSVRIRSEGRQEEMEVERLIERLRKDQEGKPYRGLNLPFLLSRRPVFVG